MPGPPPRDPGHWLRRLSDDEWLAAAATELVRCQEALERRAVRPGVTHARRAAGMALNAVLLLQDNPAWGRSYMDHVVALAKDQDAPDELRAAAQLLRDTPPLPPELITLGKPDLRVLEAARKVHAWSRSRVTALRTPAS